MQIPGETELVLPNGADGDETMQRPALGRMAALMRRALETALWLAPFGLLFVFDETGYVSWFSAMLFVLIVYFSFLGMTGNMRSAALLVSLVTASIAAISWTKAEYLGVPFVLNDLFYLTGHSLWVTLAQYKSLAIAGAAGLAAAVLVAVLVMKRPRSHLSPLMRGAALVLAVTLAVKLPEATKVAYIWDPGAERTSGAVSSFANSAVAGILWGGGKVSFANVGMQGLDGQPVAAVPVPLFSDSTDSRPDIMMILDESVFDPRDLALPAQVEIDDYFAPSDGVSGGLNVNVHGGGTWVSEFAAATGLDTRSFGDEAYYLPVLMAGRVKHSLLTHLKTLGYETLVVYCMNGSFMNAENNYRALGADRFDGMDDKHIPGIVWINRDRDFYQSTLDHIEQMKQATDKPVFAIVVTIYNHGPHAEEPAALGYSDDVQAWLERTAPGPDHVPFRDYYQRLQHNIADYNWLKAEFVRRFPERSLVVSHYGDHQPKFTKGMEEWRPEARGLSIYRTRFAIEGVNRALAPVPDWGGGNLDIAYLPGLVLSAAGLPRDAIFAARLDLMRRCQGIYATCRDRLKGRIHRTLIDEGLVEVDAIIPEEPLNVAQSRF